MCYVLYIVYIYMLDGMVLCKTLTCPENAFFSHMPELGCNSPELIHHSGVPVLGCLLSALYLSVICLGCLLSTPCLSAICLSWAARDASHLSKMST